MVIMMLRIAQKCKKHSFHKVNLALAYDMFSANECVFVGSECHAANVLPLLTLPWAYFAYSFIHMVQRSKNLQGSRHKQVGNANLKHPHKQMLGRGRDIQHYFIAMVRIKVWRGEEKKQYDAA